MVETFAQRAIQEAELYDAIERAVANLHAALMQVDAAWVRITAQRPQPSAAAFAALDSAEQLVRVAHEDLSRARIALCDFTEDSTLQ
ncbi:hypothetical protein AB7714_29965 [Tardiphaga sp. 1201_B9_N1_1]|uniref:hypothetical protein n=1 Tax=unclassified Tardiphaga TaxID=2631404 RepID=UPI003F24C993